VALLPPVLVVALYARTLGHEFVWDDSVLSLLPVYRSFDLRGVLLSPGNGYEYLPVRDLSLFWDHAWFGDWPGGFHLSNVLLFAACGALVVALYRRLLARAPDPRVAARAGGLALAAALLFVAHPLQVEPVAFLTARNALLALLFTLATLLAYLRFLASGHPLAWLASLVLCIAAVLSKATAVSLPLLVLLVHLYVRREHGLLPALRAAAPHAAVVALIAVLHLAVAAGSAMLRGALSPVDLVARLPRALFVPQFYLAKLLWPLGLSTEYVLVDVVARPVLVALSTLVLVAIAAALVWRGARERSLGWLLCLAYLVALLPVLNLLPTYPPVADRYAQIPLLFLVPLIAVPALSRLPRAAAIALTCILLAMLSTLSLRQVGVWRSSERLFAHAIAVDPRAKLSLGNLGMLYWEQDRRPEALAVLERLERVDPDDRRPDLARGWLALHQGEIEVAESRLRSATRKGGPLRHVAWMKLGDLYRREGRFPEAIQAYDLAIAAARTTPGGAGLLPSIEHRRNLARNDFRM
jgi:tetratricopeptide (TPR) repeat protein